MKLKEAMGRGYTRTGKHNELIREALRDHWSEVGPKLLEALHHLCTKNQTCYCESQGKCRYCNARQLLTEVEEVKGYDN